MRSSSLAAILEECMVVVPRALPLSDLLALLRWRTSICLRISGRNWFDPGAYHDIMRDLQKASKLLTN